MKTLIFAIIVLMLAGCGDPNYTAPEQGAEAHYGPQIRPDNGTPVEPPAEAHYGPQIVPEH